MGVEILRDVRPTKKQNKTKKPLSSSIQYLHLDSKNLDNKNLGSEGNQAAYDKISFGNRRRASGHGHIHNNHKFRYS